MAGLSIAGRGGARRALDAEINAVPMVDLMMVTISFLIVTAVWSTMGRLDASAQAPNNDPTTEPKPDTPRKVLEVEAKADRFVLTWKRGSEIIQTTDVANDRTLGPHGPRYPTLAAKVSEQWKTYGEHSRPGDQSPDRATLKVPDRMLYGDIVGIMDAVASTRRDVIGANHRVETVPAFDLVLSK